MNARRWATLTVVAALGGGLAGPATAAAATAGSAAPVDVIVRELPGTGDGPERAVESFGGTVGRGLGIIDAFSARVPADRLGALRGVPGVDSVTENAPVHLTSTEVEAANALPGSLDVITRDVIGAAGMWDRGFTGRGVDVAVIDSGVVPVDGLSAPGKVVHGPDLSFEASSCSGNRCSASPARYLDTYGHGTHMAGIIAGRDAATPSPVTGAENSTFTGVAPDARIVSVKVADSRGATDVSQVIAAIDWVVQNKNRNGLNIRVLNLSFGTDGVQDYRLDPLAYAAEVAWHSGIAVVVAAGNGGYGSEKLNDPAYDPFVIAVGGVDGRGTHGTGDDVVPSWSSTGDGTRNPDLVAPGASVVGLRAPGSFLDAQFPTARTGERFFRGSGTSQAAAVVSGAAALLVQQRPDITPDQLKALLRGTAKALPAADPVAQGRGMVDLKTAWTAATPSASSAAQTWPRSTGRGSLEAARGSVNLVRDGGTLEGEVDVTGRAWDPALVTAASASRTAWSGGSATASGWTGGAWNGREWYPSGTAGQPLGMSWSGMSWSGMSWSGMSWSGMSWSGMSWSGMSWSGMSWSGMSWSGMSWSGMSWSGMSWSGAGWGG
ncbi:serine protease AprX [Geodermatophilus tzadiensis]|uniref:Serine protease AprX n=1 Tax=Geodermatophilus tzadiensis TaxID=1137988 RepID=A0A2T0TQ31_9ACTN|nr:S8 family serine peptidase [Geodermatophilus tzadiensis]PRY47731.1 serine protease AprX [Geodermatophilus tzadiensis]